MLFWRARVFQRRSGSIRDSPYAYLLRPRVGAISFVLTSLADQLDATIDVTLAYPGGDVTMWQFLSGKVERIVVRARRLDVPAEFLTARITEPGPTRDRFKAWIESLWREKDALLATVV